MSQQQMLECPFTWQLDEKLSLAFDESQEQKIEPDEQPILALMDSIMITYFRTVKHDYDGAKVKIRETSDIWAKINQR